MPKGRSHSSRLMRELALKMNHFQQQQQQQQQH
jgi:hypothetical protein